MPIAKINNTPLMYDKRANVRRQQNETYIIVDNNICVVDLH
jgi:hypothetical protein